MATKVRDVMTTDLVTCPASTTIGDAARMMRDQDIGDVLVTRDNSQLIGIVTDRDLVVRCLADGASTDATIDQACSDALSTIDPDSSVGDAVRMMRKKSLRRLPVVDGGRAVGIVTLGDLAIEREPDSALGDISSASPNS